MRILILTIGSHGDVQPYVALGRGLQAAGHAVSLCTSLHFEAFVRANGLDYRPMSNAFVELATSAEGRAALQGMRHLPDTLRVMARLLRRARPMQVEAMHDAWGAAQAVRPDLVVFHPKLPAALDMAHTLGARGAGAAVPAIRGHSRLPRHGLPRPAARGRLSARDLRARARPHPADRDRPTGRVAPRRRTAAAPAPGRSLPRSRRPAGPDPARVQPDPVAAPTRLAIAGAGPRRLAPAARSGVGTATGAAGFPRPGAAAGYVGFGSMGGTDPARTTRIVLEALARAGCRGVLAQGWGGLGAESLPETVHAVDHVPHDWLFPRVAAVVHHGGAGTTHAGLRAGQPTVICPFFGDQPFWGRRVHALGAGPAPLPQRGLDAAALAIAIRSAVHDAEVRERAAALGERLSAEDGVARAVEWIAAARTDDAQT